MLQLLLFVVARAAVPQCMDIGNSLCIASDTFTPQVTANNAALSVDFDAFPLSLQNQIIKGSENLQLGPAPSKASPHPPPRRPPVVGHARQEHPARIPARQPRIR